MCVSERVTNFNIENQGLIIPIKIKSTSVKQTLTQGPEARVKI
jgi:hypothetical protein